MEKVQVSPSHSLTSMWSWCRAPMEICLTSGSSRSCMREVEMCLQADIQAVWATLPWKTEKGRQMKHFCFCLLDSGCHSSRVERSASWKAHCDRLCSLYRPGTYVFKLNEPGSSERADLNCYISQRKRAAKQE